MMPLPPLRAVPSFLAAAVPTDVELEPFAHIVRTSALPATEYGLLARQFPAYDVIVKGAQLGSNVAVRMSAGQALGCSDVSPSWQRFFEFHTSGDYWLEVVRVFGAHLRAAFPTLESRIGSSFDDWRVARRGSSEEADVRLDCQFVMNTPVTRRSSVKAPHVDKYDKIFSALFYMRDDDDRTAGGDLDLYRWCRSPRFVRHRVLPGDVEHVKTIMYAANTYVGFVNCPASVHGVSPREVTLTPRRYINFIAEVRIRAFDSPQANVWRRWWYGKVSDD